MSRWGVSWGSRLFRIGQSPNGRWWGYFNFMGFRFFRYLDDNGNKHWSRNPPQTNGQSSQQVPSREVPNNSGSETQAHEIRARKPSTTPIGQRNDDILQAIQDEVNK